MDFDIWLGQVRQGLSEHIGGILVVNDRVKDAHAQGITPVLFVNQCLHEFDEAQYGDEDEE
jgi:hypothetical protein